MYNIPACLYNLAHELSHSQNQGRKHRVLLLSTAQRQLRYGGQPYESVNRDAS